MILTCFKCVLFCFFGYVSVTFYLKTSVTSVLLWVWHLFELSEVLFHLNSVFIHMDYRPWTKLFKHVFICSYINGKSRWMIFFAFCDEGCLISRQLLGIIHLVLRQNFKILFEVNFFIWNYSINFQSFGVTMSIVTWGRYHMRYLIFERPTLWGDMSATETL